MTHQSNAAHRQAISNHGKTLSLLWSSACLLTIVISVLPFATMVMGLFADNGMALA